MHVDHASHATIGIRAEVSLFVRVLMQVPRIEGWGGWFSAWFRAACSTGDFFLLLLLWFVSERGSRV